MKVMMASNEMFYRDSKGRKRSDWIHEEILDNPEADLHFREGSIRRNRDRWSRGQLVEVFGEKAVQAVLKEKT